MEIPLWLADAAAKLFQRAPGSARASDERAFAEATATVTATSIPTRHGELAASVYEPDGGSAGRGVYVNFHGGGFVLRHPEQDDALCRYIAANADVTVVNVDYTPAPQSRFPGPVEQVFDAIVWAASPERDWDGTRLAVGGQSAGGALAAGAARLALENGAPTIALQVLMYPPLDLTIPAKKKRMPGTEALLVAMGPVFDRAYCPDPRDRFDRLISPAGPRDVAALAGIAPAVIVTPQRDILHAEGVRYAERLAAAGTLREHLDLPGLGHGFNIIDAPRTSIEPVYERIVHHVTSAFA